MRIVHVLTRLLRAGSEENTISTSLWQANHGHEVIVVHGPDPDPYWHDLYHDRIQFVELPELIHPIRPLQDFRAVQAMKALFSELDPDVIHTHQSKAGVIGRLAAAATQRALVVHGIHIIPFEQVGLIKRALFIAAEKLVARRTDLFTAVSRSVGQAYIDAGICAHVEPVYSGMPLDPFRSADLPEDWQELLNVSPQTDPETRPTVILMVAAFEERKRHRAFLKAIKPVLPDLPDLRILFAGKGPFEAKVRAEVADLGLQDQVVFCGFRSDPNALMALADIGVLTSEREGLPRVVVQYVATGTPVIVTDLPGISEIVQHGVNGLISDPVDMADTAAKLRDLITDRSQLTALAEGAKATDVSNWELEQLGERTTSLYEHALAKRTDSRLTAQPTSS